MDTNALHLTAGNDPSGRRLLGWKLRRNHDAPFSKSNVRQSVGGKIPLKSIVSRTPSGTLNRTPSIETKIIRNWSRGTCSKAQTQTEEGQLVTISFSLFHLTQPLPLHLISNKMCNCCSATSPHKSPIEQLKQEM